MDPRLSCIRARVDAALAKAVEWGMDVSVVAVDAAGRDVMLARRDLAAWASITPARKKACTAAAMRLPTATIAALAGQDAVMMRALEADADMLAAPGGFPIFFEGACIGGLGVAGASYHDDQAIGEAAMAAAP